MTSEPVTLEIRGLAELDEKLKLLGNDLGLKALNAALMAAAKPIMDAVKANAPIASAPYYRYWKGKKGSGQTRKLIQPGKLRASVKRKRIKNVEDAAVSIGIKNKAFYWHFIEHGTSRMAARPFMRPAFDANVEKCTEIFAERLRKQISRIAAREGIDLGDDGEGSP